MDEFTRRGFTAILVVTVGLMASGVAWADSEAPSIEPEALHARLGASDSTVVLDVRTPAEFAEGHIPGALNIPHTELAKRLSEVDPSGEVAVYCMVGPRARLGERVLTDAGREGVLHIEGGFSAWRAAGLPVSSAGAGE